MQERASAASKQDMDKCNLSGPRMLSAFDYIIGRGRSGTVIDGIGPLIDPTIEKGGETAPPLTEASENGQRAKPSGSESKLYFSLISFSFSMQTCRMLTCSSQDYAR